MLKAILHGKAGRIEHNEDESVSWSSLFQTREDLLTSTVFERFAYLSESVQACLLKHWFKRYQGVIPDGFGEFKGISYWPRYIHEHSSGTNQVEPDSIFHFDECNIIVEVKPPAGGDQYFEQWQKEIESFIQSEQGQDKPLYFLAIGRIRQADARDWAIPLLAKVDSLKAVAALEWTSVTEHIIALTSDDGMGDKTVVSKQDRFILQDILEGLSLYGLQVSPFKWSQFNVSSLPKLNLKAELFEASFN
ncbi:hypothetical protein L2737_19640 [Shewanella electrodiphila]|uniref:Uncharacterized protein n=1 Tax=Shewanella electrodiphila TaxID=934143 RepID=A0ABT0KUK7_9GAMM|nr:hypothetical protein [Shewanella electrodiphila]MCL1047518.1 hypothetical protein [Shewanella electrodiphila]